MTVYVYDSPGCGPGRFFGRELLVRSLVRGLAKKRGFALLGGPRTGRTSVLDQVAATIQESWTRTPAIVKVVPVRADAAVARRNRRALLVELWRALTHAVRQPQVAGQAGAVEAPKLKLSGSDSPWATFCEACAELWDRLSGTSGWCQWCLMVDNGDILATFEMEQEQEPLAKLAASEEPWAPRGVVIAAGRLLRESIWDHHSPLHFLRPMLLGALKESEAETMIRIGFPDAEEDWVARLLRMTGKHPYLLQRALAELEAHGSNTPLEDIGYAIDADANELMEAIWQQFDLDRGATYRGAYAAPEHALMQYLLDRGVEADVRTAERELGIKPLKEYAEFLEYVGVIERLFKREVTYYRPQCATWNVWYRQRINR